MKVRFVGGVAILALTSFGPAKAADLPRVPRKPAAPVMAPVPTAYNWSGFYFGAHLGGGWADKTFVEKDPVNLALGFPPSQSVSASGLLGGLQAGWNYQAGNVVAGIEADASLSGIDGSGSTDVLLGGVVPSTFTRSADIGWLATVTGRLGYAMDRWLVYGKGGVAFSRDKYNDDLVSGGVLVGSASGKENRVGWTIGGGVEWAFLDRWSTKLEYNYMDFGSRSVTFDDSVQGTSYSLDVDQRIHVVKVGVNYRY